MAEHGERVRIILVARRQDLDRLPVAQRQPQILDAAVAAHEHCFLGKLRADRARGVEPCRTVRKFEFGLVGKDDLHVGTG